MLVLTTTAVIWDDSVPPEFPLYDALHKDISTYERIMARVEAKLDAEPPASRVVRPPAHPRVVPPPARTPSADALPPMNNFQVGGGTGSGLVPEAQLPPAPPPAHRPEPLVQLAARELVSAARPAPDGLTEAAEPQADDMLV